MSEWLHLAQAVSNMVMSIQFPPSAFQNEFCSVELVNYDIYVSCK